MGNEIEMILRLPLETALADGAGLYLVSAVATALVLITLLIPRPIG